MADQSTYHVSWGYCDMRLYTGQKIHFHFEQIRLGCAYMHVNTVYLTSQSGNYTQDGGTPKYITMGGGLKMFIVDPIPCLIPFF